MYPNLNAARKAKNISNKQIANAWGKPYTTACDILNGKSSMLYQDAVTLKRVFFPEYDFDWLFNKSVDIA